jgi:aminodeoxyfutalosine deaminase
MAIIMPADNNIDSQTYRAAWFIGPNGAIHDASIVLGGGKLLDVQSSPLPNAVDLGEVAIVPGLVNAHTHLEFSLLPGPMPTTGRFTDWIRSVVRYRREHPGLVAEAIRAGIEESLRCGTTLIGDIATTGWSMDDYLDGNFSGVVFQELLGLTDERVASQWEVARRPAATEFQTTEPHRRTPHPNPLPSKARGEGTGKERHAASSLIHHPSSLVTHPSSLIPLLGLSPHAPYSVHPELFQRAVELARQSSRPLAMHLAETEAELELLAEGTGEFRELLEEFGLWRAGLFGGGKRPMQYLETLASLPAPLVVHGNYLDDAELQFLAARPHMTVVYCPRTHAAFGHREHPWRRLRELGGSVAIGTDSRASNPDLSVFAELQFLAERHPDVSHLELLELATTHGRRTLTGCDGKDHRPANFTVIRLSNPHFREPARDLFAPENHIVGTMISGQWHFTPDGLRFSERGT